MRVLTHATVENQRRIVNLDHARVVYIDHGESSPTLAADLGAGPATVLAQALDLSDTERLLIRIIEAFKGEEAFLDLNAREHRSAGAW